MVQILLWRNCRNYSIIAILENLQEWKPLYFHYQSNVLIHFSAKVLGYFLCKSLFVSLSVPYRKSVCNRACRLNTPKRYAAQRGRDAGEKRTHATGMHPLSPAILSVAIPLAAQDHAVAGGGKASVSPCEPLCALLLAEASVYPLSLVKANVGCLCQRRRSPYDRCIGNVGMTAFPVLFAAFSRTKKKAVGYGFVKG